MNQRGIAPLVIVAIVAGVAVVAGVGIYVVTRGGENAGGGGGEPDFEISANPHLISIPQGGSENITITIKSLNGFNSTVEFFGVTGTDIGHYIDASCPSVTPPPNGQVTTTLTISVDSDAPTGEYYIDWHAKIDESPLIHTAFIGFTVTASS